MQTDADGSEKGGYGTRDSRKSVPGKTRAVGALRDHMNEAE